MVARSVVFEDPIDWEECMDANGDVYYFNVKTGGSQWERPRFQKIRSAAIGSAEDGVAEMAPIRFSNHHLQSTFYTL
jgi:hypothetical protein